jgi:SAM-dependent methyltransferase
MPSFINWVPTPNDDISAFFDLAPVTSSDVVYDLGSGDGRLLFAALEKGAGKVVGVELDGERVRAAMDEARRKGLADRATFLNLDVLDANLTEATAALKPKFERELAPRTRVVMESFPIPSWKPVRTIDLGYKRFYLYFMPPEIGEEAGDGPVMDISDYS